MTSAEATQQRRRVTIVDVAKHAGVSTSSASKVLRNAYGASAPMRARVQAAMDELGYRPHGPARGMRGRTYTLGVVVSDIENPFFSLVTDGLAKVARPQAYEVFVSPAGYRPAEQKAVIEAMIDHRMDGLVLVAPVMTNEELDLLAKEIPLIVVGHHSESTLLDSVASDDAHGSRLVVEHLLGLGHRNIAFVMNEADRSDNTRLECHRLRGFEDAMADHGLTDSSTVIDSRWTLEGGREAARQLDALQSRPTAVHAGADIVAFGMMSELWDHSRSVPEAYSIVGFDNSRTASLGPIRLTTVDQSGLLMGERVGHLLLERIEGRAEARHEVLEPRLVIRDSTGYVG
ncbi:LacI family DNA-binding transcriptional regulator [Tessaracoccus sp. MC1627]|uniref:LacI family DNA-binding transcriptional regulator n=1 Tax=Tessaracoccus sp. MC1627 TaxID=2760312 RepID=UPI0015FF8426|nr:LacI family DNA-binding transcriptional regulator [Tessaracoccus sp. MC1627]MBB1511087.1 LacI family DNA-binding transcriptional regulator [Tessaracoccus sp. MC1627]